MSYYASILGGGQAVDFETAVLMGKAPDGGLFVPQQLPQVTPQQLDDWRTLSYPEIAFEVLSLFIDRTTVPAADLRKLVDESFATFEHPEIIPHHRLKNDIVVQELFRGPTLSFKDVAMGFVVNLFDYFLKRRGERMTLMVATSGDTGPAAAHASIGKPSLSTWLFFPEGLITEEQVRQMTTITAPNVHAVSVRGCRNGSDDLDVMIAARFADAEFREELNLSSVNSINWARVMTQIVHYFYGYFQNSKQTGDTVHFSVPCGAFGNMCAGSIARRMGLPVGEMIVANNANTTLSTVLQTGEMKKLDITNTLASAIDIAVPMNFWRHLYFSLDSNAETIRAAWEQYESTGSTLFSEEQRVAFAKGFKSHTVDDPAVLATIKSTWDSENYLLDPHGAVAVAAANQFREKIAAGPIVCLATAHPAKFPSTTQLAIDQIPEQGKHDSLEDALTACERTYSCDYENMMSAVPVVMRKVFNGD